MSIIKITENVLLQSGQERLISIELHKSGVVVTITNGTLNAVPGRLPNNSVSVVEWQNITDVDYLSTEFQYEPLKVFKSLVAMLNSISQRRELYNQLIE